MATLKLGVRGKGRVELCNYTDEVLSSYNMLHPTDSMRKIELPLISAVKCEARCVICFLTVKNEPVLFSHI